MIKDEFFLLKSGKKSKAIPIRMFGSPDEIKLLSSPLGWKVFREMAEPSCPMDLAKKLGVHEQKVYYYVNKFRKANLIREVKREARHGTVARFYMIRSHAFGIIAGNPDGEEIELASPSHRKALEPFVRDGKLNARIIVGSPDPHGPLKARGSDSCCAIDFALFLGAFTDGRQVPNYRLDVEVRERDLRGNLILFGGPAVNMVTRKLTRHLPVLVEVQKDVRRIRSRITNKVYSDDDCGMVTIIDNPWDSRGKVMVMAGPRFQGTRAAVLAFVTKTSRILQGNRFKRDTIATVVKGYDMNGDGIIDSAEILE
jgi:hypothetical protein